MKSIKPKTQPGVKTVAQRIKQLADPIYQTEVARGAAVFNDYEAAKSLLAKWQSSDPRGTPTEMALRDEKLADAQHKFYAIEARYQTFRGDFGEVERTALPSNTAISSSPTPLTTSDIAHGFAGLRWKTDDQWKKNLGNKPKWLGRCVVIPGSQGHSQTRWNPVLIGAAIVRDGYARANSLRARFQKVPQLQPWLEEWKTHEADYLDQS
jgi:hypothetical protein